MKLFTLVKKLVGHVSAISARGISILVIASAGGVLSTSAQAQNNVVVPYEAAASFSAWNANFLVESGGYTYYNSELNSVGTSEAKMYTGALDVAIAEDNYECTHSTSAMNLVTALLNTFDSTFGNGANWSYDGWNDDIGWMCNIYVRGYQITGNTAYLTIAENNYNMAYSRGWDNTLGGGIYENTTDADKECLSNDPFVWEGVGLYEVTGNTTYLTEAENIYAWVRSHLFNSTNSTNAIGAPGALCQGEQVNGTLESGDNVYNSGSFLEAANSLYHVTGNSQYYNDAVLDINHVLGSGSILHSTNNTPGNQWAYWFIKGLSDFCTDNNLWPTYYSWMLGNANAAWAQRNSANLTWNDWTTATNSAGTDAVVMSSAVAIWQLINVPQQYQVINEYSGLAMDLISGNEANNAPIEQWSTSGGVNANQQWMLAPLSNGSYAIISSLTNEAASVYGASTSNGAVLNDWPFSITDTSQQFTEVSEGSGWYELKNVNSGLVLDDSALGTSNGTPIIQYQANGGSNQMWKIQPVTSFGGPTEIQCVISGDVLDVSGASTTDGASVIQYPYQGHNNQLWTFTPTSMGYYEIVNLNSGQQLNVNGNSYAYGASIIQWPGGAQSADQWLPVQNSDGTYTLFNLNSGLVLDDPGGSTVQGTQFDQYGWNGGTNQKFNLIAR